MARGGLGISHLLFADDILLFSEAKVKQMRVIMKVLKDFEEVSGLAVNMDKSKAIVSKNVNRRKREKLASVSSIALVGNLGKYLGVPLVQGRVKKEDFNFLIDKLKVRLSGWKAKLLNRAGRVTLACSVLIAMPVYNMQTTWVPQQVCDDIDRIIRSFVWHHGSNRGMNLVQWDVVTKRRMARGLGIRQARLSNVAFLGKLC